MKRTPAWKHPFGVPNQKHSYGMMANYRTAGLADMALAIQGDRPHRCSLELALHVVDVMTAILKSAETGKFVAMQTTCERPAALGPKEAKALLAKWPRLGKAFKENPSQAEGLALPRYLVHKTYRASNRQVM